MTPRDRLMVMFRGDGTQTHYELISNRGGRHAVPAMDAADIILEAVWPQYDAAMAAVEAAWALIVALDNPHLEVVGSATENARAALAFLREPVPA